MTRDLLGGVLLAALVIPASSATSGLGANPIGIRSFVAHRSKITYRGPSCWGGSIGSSAPSRHPPVNEISDGIDDDWIDDEYRDILDVRGSSPASRMKSEVQMCSAVSKTEIAKNLLRGSLLRVASDLSGGTPLETIKTRVTTTKDTMTEAYRNVVREGGFGALWAGTPSRTVEGALIGAVFLLGSSVTKKQVLAMGGGPNLAALCGGIVGGVAQALIMTPAGMVFTSLNVNRGKPGHENDNALTVTRRIIKEKGIMGMYIGGGAMAIRQASNWAGRSCFTEIARTTFRMSEFGLLGEIGSGVIGGVGSCWNTPIETIRVVMQGDVSSGRPAKSTQQYWNEIKEDGGMPGLFRGVTPRAIQAIWQTVFMVVVPNILGV